MQKVVGSNPISRLPPAPPFRGRFLVVTLDLSGALAEWLRSGLQSRLHRFDSGRRLSKIPANGHVRSDGRAANPKACPDMSRELLPPARSAARNSRFACTFGWREILRGRCGLAPPETKEAQTDSLTVRVIAVF